MAAVTAILIGAGFRGRTTYGGYALANPERFSFVAVAEPEADRRAAFAAQHGIAEDAVFHDWKPLLKGPRLAPAAVIATDDMTHAEPALAALRRGYHVLLEKPIAPTLPECVQVVQAAQESGQILQIAHVLRYTQFYRKATELVTSGRLGRVLSVDMKEHVAHWHMAHSYVRGKFRNRAIAAPIILAKGSHDLDLLVWLVGSPARRLACFGELSHFCEAGAPVDAPARCTDGCPIQRSCPHDAVRFYLEVDEKLAGSWPWADVSVDPSPAHRRRALEEGPFGRCVYHCDNDAPDHQVIAIEFEGGVTATFAMHGHATHETRTIRISGTQGELRGLLHTGVIEVTRHGSLETERFDLAGSSVGHFGGDEGLIGHFIDLVARHVRGEAQTSGRVSLESHVLGFAAEQSRVQAKVIDLATFRRSAEEGGSGAAGIDPGRDRA